MKLKEAVDYICDQFQNLDREEIFRVVSEFLLFDDIDKEFSKELLDLINSNHIIEKLLVKYLTTNISEWRSNPNIKELKDSIVDAENWIDCGYEDSKTGNRSHLWLKKEDIKSYCNQKNNEIVELRKEIKKIKEGQG